MRILVADDDALWRRRLETALTKFGHELQLATNGREAWKMLEAPGAPKLAILDWMMPDLDGIEICRRARVSALCPDVYIMLLTARGLREDLILGLEAGANDYMVKPFDVSELRVRLQVGIRVLQLQERLADRVAELEDALSRINQLRGLLPICSYCKRIRDDQNYWQQLETYVSSHSDATFTHGICPHCYDMLMKTSLEMEPDASLRA